MVPFTNEVEDASVVPDDDALYHFNDAPVTEKLASVGLVPLQNVCGELAVGADGVVLTVAVTPTLVPDSQPFTVWLT